MHTGRKRRKSSLWKNPFIVENVMHENCDSCNLTKARNILENMSFCVCAYLPYCLFPSFFIACVHPRNFLLHWHSDSMAVIVFIHLIWITHTSKHKKVCGFLPLKVRRVGTWIYLNKFNIQNLRWILLFW